MPLKTILPVLAVLSTWLPAAVWNPLPETSPTLHTTTMELAVQLKQPVPPKIFVDLTCMNESVWRTELATGGQIQLKAALTPDRFTILSEKKDQPKVPLTFGQVRSVSVTVDGKSDSGLAGLDVRFTGHDGVTYPWEKDPSPAGRTDKLTWWPGVSKNNAGHFGWRYEPNGLLINNVSFNALERSWYYFKPFRQPNESFQFNSRILGALEPKKQTVVKSDTDKKTGNDINRAGLEHQYELKVDKGIYAHDAIQADWTSFRWRRMVNTTSGKRYYQELRYGILAPGVQVETDSPAYQLSFQDATKEKAPAGIAWIGPDGLRVDAPGTIEPARMKANWLLLLSNDGTPEIPVLVVFQRRPEKIEWRADSLIIHRAGGVGTLAIGTPFGVRTLDINTLEQWRKTPKKIDPEKINRFANFLMAYAWKCEETFAVDTGWVRIKNRVTFLPWSDDWNSRPESFAPVPPLIPFSIMRDMLPKECVAGCVDLHIPTKWGPYWAYKGDSVEYKLPIPRMWDQFPLKVEATEKNKVLYSALTRSLARKGIESSFGMYLKNPTLTPANYPHCASCDAVAGLWRSANFLSPEDREFFRRCAGQKVREALFPQTYRLRCDPITGARYLTCFDGPYEINGDNLGDIDYWQGLGLYGVYTYAKYSGDWNLIRKYWPIIRSIYTYWESLHSWVFMFPGAREAGEMYGADMLASSYDAAVGFYQMARQAGTPYQQDLAAYLLAKGSVDAVAGIDFFDWCKQMDHQEIRAGGIISNGLGERWVASIKFLDTKTRDMSGRDPWWMSGTIGPLGTQFELLDIYLERAPKQILHWESTFRQMCPDDGLLTHDTGRVISHMMLRMSLTDPLRQSAVRCLKKYRSEYMTRDTHVIAAVLAWDCPVRLVDWAPGYIESGRWIEKDRTAQIGIDAGKTPADIRLLVRADKLELVLDNQPLAFTVSRQTGEWKDLLAKVPPGRHNLRIVIGK